MNIIQGVYNQKPIRLYFADTNDAIKALDKFKQTITDGDHLDLIVDHIVLARAIKPKKEETK